MSKPQPMPIIDRLHPGTQYLLVSSKGTNYVKVSNNLFEILTSCKRFRLNDTQRVTGWNNDTRRFGELRLPYERVWIEWNNRRNTEYGYGVIFGKLLFVCLSRIT